MSEKRLAPHHRVTSITIEDSVHYKRFHLELPDGVVTIRRVRLRQDDARPVPLLRARRPVSGAPREEDPRTDCGAARARQDHAGALLAARRSSHGEPNPEPGAGGQERAGAGGRHGARRRAVSRRGLPAGGAQGDCGDAGVAARAHRRLRARGDAPGERGDCGRVALARAQRDRARAARPRARRRRGPGGGEDVRSRRRSRRSSRRLRRGTVHDRMPRPRLHRGALHTRMRRRAEPRTRRRSFADARRRRSRG